MQKLIDVCTLSVNVDPCALSGPHTNIHNYIFNHFLLHIIYYSISLLLLVCTLLVII